MRASCIIVSEPLELVASAMMRRNRGDGGVAEFVFLVTSPSSKNTRILPASEVRWDSRISGQEEFDIFLRITPPGWPITRPYFCHALRNPDSLPG
jgi:hypothetical protein